MNLNEGNYFSTDANRAYMSASQLKSFLDCPAQTIAELNGLYQRETTTALLVGSYVDAHFSGTLDQFRAAHPEIYNSRTGELKADYRQAEEIIQYLSNDRLLMAMLSGESQRIVTGEIAGVPFRGKLDCLLSAKTCQEIAGLYPEMAEELMLADGAIVDLKIMRDLEPVWVPGAGRMSFVQAWRYDLQLAIYQHLLGQRLPCYLVVATKEKVPDKALIHIPQYMLDAALKAAESAIKRIDYIKHHPDQAEACGRCEWCKTTKVISAAIDADELEGVSV